jgi:hypothetical protein
MRSRPPWHEPLEYTARAATRQPAPAVCRGMERRKLAGADDLYTARAYRQLAAGGSSWRAGSLLARTTLTLCEPPPGAGRSLSAGGRVCGVF